MGSIRVIEPGMLSTVQDLGRPGWSSSGVPVGGSADCLSLRLANRLVGNPPNAAGIEMTLLGATIQFESAASFALCGAESVSELVAGRHTGTVIPWTSVDAPAGAVLRVGRCTRGARSYLAVRGGIHVPQVMGSASTYLPAGFGGHEGRALRAGDRLRCGDSNIAQPRALSEACRLLAHELFSRRIIRAVGGAQADAFADVGAIWSSAFTVANRSDRMGLRLEGTAIPPPFGGRMTSEGMMCGAVEVPADGQPIVLLSDHPTTGGYPVIAAVASVDLPVLGQLRPRDQIRFERVTLDQARALYARQQATLAAEEA